MTFDDIKKEMIYKHTVLFGRYGHDIPSSFLTFSASDFIKAISESRSTKNSYQNFNGINTAEVLYRDFVDPRGEDEMTKTLELLLG